MSVRKSGRDSDNQEQSLLPVGVRPSSELKKWKIAALVAGILLVLFIGADIYLMVKVSANQPRKINYTFASDLAEALIQTSITPTQFINMLKALTTSYNEIWFQSATKIDSWKNGDSGLTLSRVIDFFTTKVVDRLTLIQFKNGQQIVPVGLYTHVSFKIPQNWDSFLVKDGKQYFTFEIDDKQSTIVGGKSDIFLKMDGQVDNLTQCKIMSMSQNQLLFLNSIDLIYKSTTINNPLIQFIDLSQQKSKCFSSNSKTINFFDKLKLIVGNIDTIKYQINGVYSFKLIGINQ